MIQFQDFREGWFVGVPVFEDNDVLAAVGVTLCPIVYGSNTGQPRKSKRG